MALGGSSSRRATSAGARAFAVPANLDTDYFGRRSFTKYGRLFSLSCEGQPKIFVWTLQEPPIDWRRSPLYRLLV